MINRWVSWQISIVRVGFFVMSENYTTESDITDNDTGEESDSTNNSDEKLFIESLEKQGLEENTKSNDKGPSSKKKKLNSKKEKRTWRRQAFSTTWLDE
ncbi:hypothetical protein ALC62_11101 [Cyphomyrmex costatus]|uniref:Uncharacterized protein n=1 Tax=Cyphomyrmex costatus TaxID=456900 RepID=A0A151ICS2_9HYME|nr:hypothetical protein ALC62_11101 [Cyphomyrmex costatus]